MTGTNILTVDLEDWYHICGIRERLPLESWGRLESRVERNTTRILQVLAESRTKATFFVLGFIAERHPELIRTIHEEGHEIACHGYAHRRVYTMTAEEFRQDLRRGRDAVLEITGLPPKGYRAPEWSIRDDSLWALDILCQEGFSYDSSMAPLPIIGSMGYPRVPHRIKTGQGSLWEFPPLVASACILTLPVGGGWGLRFFPYSAIRKIIHRMNHHGRPALVYLHPREMDPAPPRIPLPLIKRLVLHAQIENAEKRLQRLLRDFRFTSISSYEESSCSSRNL